MYCIIFRPKDSGIRPCATMIVDEGGLPAALDVLERAKAQYKIYKGGAEIRPRHFGWSSQDWPGWLTPEARFEV